MKLKNWWMKRRWQKAKEDPQRKWHLCAVVGDRHYDISAVEGEYWHLAGRGKVHYTEIDQLDYAVILGGYA